MSLDITKLKYVENKDGKTTAIMPVLLKVVIQRANIWSSFLVANLVVLRIQKTHRI